MLFTVSKNRCTWRHLSIAVVPHETVVQRVRSNRWRFNFEMAGTNQLFMKSGYDHHHDIYTYNLTGPKRFTLDVPINSPPYAVELTVWIFFEEFGGHAILGGGCLIMLLLR